MFSPRRLCAALVRYCLAPLGRSVMALGGIDMYLEERRERAFDGYRERGYLPPVLPLPFGPPHAHPERLRPEVPLTGTELALLDQLRPQPPQPPHPVGRERSR